MKILRMFLKHPQLLTLEGAEYINGELHKMTDKTRAEIFSLVREARHIILNKAVVSKVYSSNSEENIPTGPRGMTNVMAKKDIAELPMGVPFKVCWFELFGEDGTIPMFYTDTEIGVAAIIGLLVHEVSPDYYDVFTMEAWQGGTLDTRQPSERPGVNMTIFRGVPREMVDLKEEQVNVQVILRLWLQALNYGELGVQTTDEVIFIPSPTNPKKTKVHKINKIIRITSKQYRKEAEARGSREIDWSHRWEVRGHWRKVAGIGKDRDGSYTVAGFTWVSDHVRGPEEAELVVKTRVKA